MEAPELQSERSKLIIQSLSLEDLNEELLTEILIRLPYKQVVQCKCVSKKWFSLIYSSQFAARFSSMKILPWTFIYPTHWRMEEEGFPKFTSNDPVFESPGFSLRFLPFYRQSGRSGIRILNTYNDLILCFHYLNDSYYICNPLTMQWISLPPAPGPKLPARVDFICELKEDDLKNHQKYVFKVARVSMQYAIATIKIEIFSSEIGKWKEISTPAPFSDGFDLIQIEEVAIYNEKVILLGFMSELRGMRFTNISIVIDDIFSVEVCSGHHYRAFKISADFLTYYQLKGLCRVPNGGLRLARVFKSESRSLIDIWELREEDDYEWRLIHICELGEDGYGRRLLQEVCLHGFCSENDWVSENYREGIFMPHMTMEDSSDDSDSADDSNLLEDSDMEMEEGIVPTLSVVGFDPCDADILYLNLHIEGGRMGKYDMRQRNLSIVEHTDLSSFDDCKTFQLVLQLPMPTPLFEM